MSETIKALRLACEANPNDYTLRLVLADALGEAGNGAEAGKVRRDARRASHVPRKAPAERTVKITETTNTGLPGSYGHARNCMRVVECRLDQNGWRSERGVVVHWESEHYAARSTGPKSNYQRLLTEAEGRQEKLLRRLLAVDA